MTSNSNLSTDLLSERYASALYTLSTEKKCVDQVLKDLNKIVEIFENNKNFSLLIKSPLILSEDKLKVINTILKKNESHKLTHNLMKIV